MDLIFEKPSNPSRTLVYGLLASCPFTANAERCLGCPLKGLRSKLSIDKKQEYVMELSDKEIERVLTQHKSCYEKRLSDLNQW